MKHGRLGKSRQRQGDAPPKTVHCVHCTALIVDMDRVAYTLTVYTLEKYTHLAADSNNKIPFLVTPFSVSANKCVAV